MLNFQQHQGSFEFRLLTIGIPNYIIRDFISMVICWEMNSGVEWTIKRLKSLKVDLIRRKGGLPPLTWVRKNRSGDIRGTLGSLFRWSDKSESNFGRSVQALMAYTFYILPSLTETQKEKFLSAVHTELPDNLDGIFHLRFSQSISKFIERRKIRLKVEPLLVYSGSSEKKAPRLFGKRSGIQADRILEETQMFNTPEGHYLLCNYPEYYLEQLRGLDSYEYFDNMVSNNRIYQRPAPPVDLTGGEVHFLQEPGGKLRSIASPYRIHQRALAPLAQSLYKLVSELPWDCTFDQSRAIPFIQSHLRQGGQVHSIDLSSATDYFPLSIQLTALSTVFGDDPSISLFEEISRSKWKSSLGTVRWKKGQPLGLYPSFASFTLTHGLLLLHLAGHYCDQFFVVGDDVVILDDNLKDSYIAMLDRMNCPWSLDKSISSSKLSEFAGKIITSERVIPQLKWRKISDDNFLDICRLLGRPSRCLLSKRQKRVFDSIAHLCEPIGLNYSLPGDNLLEMMKRTLQFYHPEEVVLGSLMGLKRRVQSNLYNSEYHIGDLNQISEILATFDEKVKLAMAQTIFNRWETCLQIGLEGLETLPPALGLVPRLPYKEYASSRKTTLERYERLIDQKT